MDGVIHVTCGVLDVFWLSCARYVNVFRVCWHALTDIEYKIIFNIYLWEKICFFVGRSFVSDTWKLGALGHDGKGSWPNTSTHVKKSRVRALQKIPVIFILSIYYFSICLSILYCWFSKPAEKFVRRGRLDWPEGATSRESIKAVLKLPRLQVCMIICIFKLHRPFGSRDLFRGSLLIASLCTSYSSIFMGYYHFIT